MYMTVDNGYVPGRVRKVLSSRFPLVSHWGAEGWARDAKGFPTMWHAQKGDVMRCTSWDEFSPEPPRDEDIQWTPRPGAQQFTVIQRLQSIEGLPWNLGSSNCEHDIRWAVEGRAHSPQLAVGVLAAFVVGALIVSNS